MESGTSVNTFLGNRPLFEPGYLNLEHFFYGIIGFFRHISEWFRDNEMVIRIIALLICLFFLAVALYAILGIIKIWKEEKEHLRHAAHGHSDSAHGAGDHEINPHHEHYEVTPLVAAPAALEWDRVMDYAASQNENDWRQAILEADIILDRLLDSLEYTGDDLGEKLRAAKVGDFVTLNEAWEAHKVRNKIAHDGAAFNLPRREFIRVLGMYEKVFREFNYI